MMSTVRLAVPAFLAIAIAAMATPRAQQAPARPDDSFRFKSGVELINVTATVSDASGRFVSGLRQEDFLVFEDNQPQTITHFSAERVPVSLGIVLDTSGSMAGEKMDAARSALDRFLYELLDRDDEIFLYRFSDTPVLVQGWTSDRRQLTRALDRASPTGGTAMYDAVAEAVPLAQSGKNRKKALVIISDGNDTSSQTTVSELKQMIRESEVLVYAIGIDGDGDPIFGRQPPGTFPPRVPPPPTRLPIPRPFPPGRRPPGLRPPGYQAAQRPGRAVRSSSERVNVVALRDLTDDSGGRTEIVRDSIDLNPATANIAAELSQQYYLGYPANGKRDGRWHAIRVDVKNPTYRVRARRGYVAN
jgi:Ca-activated chloride channel family protein